MPHNPASGCWGEDSNQIEAKASANRYEDEY
jgi:hypothetical protein